MSENNKKNIEIGLSKAEMREYDEYLRWFEKESKKYLLKHKEKTKKEIGELMEKDYPDRMKKIAELSKRMMVSLLQNNNPNNLLNVLCVRGYNPKENKIEQKFIMKDRNNNLKNFDNLSDLMKFFIQDKSN